MSTPSKPDGVEYREVSGFPAYCVGSDGTAWSRWKWVGKGPGRGMGRVLGTFWKPLKPQRYNQFGHQCVDIHPGGRRVAVHTLVLESFVGPCPEGMEARHFPDRDPANNRRENLSWATREKNQADRIGHGTLPCGERHYNARLTDDEVREIRRLYALPPAHRPKQKDLAKRFKVTQPTISDIVNIRRRRYYATKPV